MYAFCLWHPKISWICSYMVLAQHNILSKTLLRTKNDLSKGHTDLKVFHIGNYTTEGQTDWILFINRKLNRLKWKSTKKIEKKKRTNDWEKDGETSKSDSSDLQEKCTTKKFRIGPIKSKHKKWISIWVVIRERNSYGNRVPGSRTISMTEREKDTGVYWRNISKDVKETERDP